MTSLELENNDLTITANGLFVIISEKEQLAQKLEQRLKLFFAEWFLDTTRGLPYFENIFGEKATNIVTQIITDEILKESEVTNVIDIVTTFENRHYKYSANVISIFGEQNFIFNG